MVNNRNENADNCKQNWLDLANHFQAKVLKRTSEVTFLHTKAGFLIAAAVVLLQVITDMPKFYDLHAFAGLVLSMVLAFASIIVSIVSMHISKSPAPLNMKEMISVLTKQPQMTREVFANWLAQSYAQAYEEFNRVYTLKYNQQIASAILLVLSFAIIVILKGVSIYA